MQKLIAATLVFLSLYLVNCKDNGTDDPEPAKTLNKSLIVDKDWKSTNPPYGFYLRSDGKYCGSKRKNVFGTWQWLNNSDSLEIVDLTVPRQVW
ncbi:MAG: hypothetical protein ACKVQB_07990 [Bacteroidia bacterium]